MAFSQIEIDELAERIKPHIADIREKAGKSGGLCRNILEAYRMFHYRPEAGAFSILECMMDVYENDLERVDCDCVGLSHQLGCPNHEICL